MNDFSSKKLLLISPHFQVFVKNQANFIRPHFAHLTVLLPHPYFSKLAEHLPFINKRFSFLQNTLNSLNLSFKNFEIIPSTYFTLPLDILRQRKCYLASKSCLKTLKSNHVHFDLVHAHFLENGFVGIQLKKLYNKPFVITAHGGDVYHLPFKNTWYNNLARYVLSEADQIITVSNSNKKIIQSLGVDCNKIHVIHNGYDKSLFKPYASNLVRKQLGLPLNKKILLCVGNLVEVKGHNYLLDAMRIIIKKDDSIILVIVGSGPMESELKKKTDILGLSEKIIFVGHKPHCEIPLWMNASDLFVLPSLAEGFPTVIPEALSCGKPVIATDVGGVVEALPHNDLGYVVKSKDSIALADAILEGLNKKWEKSFIIEFAQKYSLTALVKQILNVYQKIELNNQ